MRRATAVLVAVLAVAAVSVGVGARQLAATRASRASHAYGAEVAHERWVHAADLKFFEAKVVADPGGASDRANLARLYLQHARETGDYEFNVRAESLARRSLQMRTAHNGPAFGILASALLAEHRFPEALVAAESLVAFEDFVPAHRAMVGEIAFEMGKYELAGRMFDSVRADAERLEIAPRMARWAELHGQVDQARVLLTTSFDEAKRLKHLTRETVSWYALRLGDLELRAGNLVAAERDYREGLAIFPGDYRLDAAMARLSLAAGRPREAVTFGEDAIRVVLEPATLGTLGDAYLALGDTAKAEEMVHVMEVAVTGQAGPIHRQWELFLLDHNRDVELVASRAEEELRTRKDIYGYDALAWARFKQGRHAEARTLMDSALVLGTRDPLLARHDSVIGR